MTDCQQPKLTEKQKRDLKKAEALRQNLRKRKEQKRSRNEADQSNS